MTSRSITGLVLAALLAVPAAAQAQARRGSGGSGIWLGGQFGAELGDADGYQLRFDVEVPITRLTPRVQVAGVGSLSYSGLKHDLSVVELVPAVRINWILTPDFGMYGDLGLGYAHAWAHDNSANGATMRFGAGAFYEMTPTVRFLGEFAIHPHFGDYDQTTTTLMLGVRFRI